MFQARPAAVAPVLCLMLGVMLAAGGCAGGTKPAAGEQSSGPTMPSPTAAEDTKALAADYMAIALPANHRLDLEVDGYDDQSHHNLAAAQADLRAEVVTERNFDRLLLKIPFPARIEAVAQALVVANKSRIALTERQARSQSITALVALDDSHKAADAAVEVQVRIIRSELGLPPPQNS